MTALEDLQRLFRQALFAARPDEAAVLDASRLLSRGPGLSRHEQLSIYRRGIRGTLQNALGRIYPACRKLTGPEFFDAMARRFILETPSHSPDLADYGAGLAGFIAAFEPAGSLPYLPDVARLEWSWHRAFHAADEGGLRLDALARVTESQAGGLVLQLPDAASLLASDYPVHRIWETNQDDFTGDDAVDLGEGGVRLIVWRKDLEMRVEPLAEGEWVLLEAISRESSLAELHEGAVGHKLQPLLQSCVRRGWIAGFRLP